MTPSSRFGDDHHEGIFIFQHGGRKASWPE
jgi:hypothetical protein